jgi:4-amino-4-deoxy-L-arabinose transferase-like glycosyltransferase
MKKILELFRSERNFLIAVFGFSLLVRLAYALPLPPDRLSPDAMDWMESAWQLSQGAGLGAVWRAPGFIFFLSLIFSVFGKSVLAVRIAQALLGALTCVLTYKTGKRLFSENTGRLAAVLLSFYPYSVAYTGDLLSETFLTFMIAASVFLAVKAAQEPGWKNAAAAGVLFGLTALTKSTVLPFFAFACAWLWWNTRSFKIALVAGLSAAGAILPWSLRNYVHYDKDYVMPVSTPWPQLYGSSCDTAFWSEMGGERDTPQNEEMAAPAIPPDWEYLQTLPLPERDRICKEKALTWMRENPDKLLALFYLRVRHFWRLYPMMAYPWQKYAAMATSGVYIPLAFIGFLLSLRRFRQTSLFAGLFVLYTAVHMFFVVVLRYRVPIDPYIIILAAFAVTSAAAWLRGAGGKHV